MKNIEWSKVKLSNMRDLSGMVFGNWTVLSLTGKNKYGMSKWLCKCKCGKEKIVLRGSLCTGTSIGCGCTNRRGTTHGFLIGGKVTPEYRTWRNMIGRCYYKKHISYKSYGDKGVSVCDRWLNSFENFIMDMGYKPSPIHSIDRFPNKKGNYEPANCRWATRKQQFDNLNKNVWTTFRGERMIAAEFKRRAGISSNYVSILLKTKSGNEVYEMYKNKTV